MERLVRGDAAFSEKTLVFASGAVAGTNSDFAALCLDALLPSSADVVFLEFDINSAGMGMEGVARSYESLIRKLYRLPHNPAVVLVHVPSDHQKHFQDSIADASNVLLPFYESSAISLRDAYWHHGQEEVWSEDRVHPNDLGNLVIATLAHRLLGIYKRDSASFGAVQPLRSDSMLAADRDDETVCVHSAGLRTHANSEWVLTEEHDKWGLVAHNVGARIDVEFAPSVPRVLFQVAYLQSYAPEMGKVSIECLEECTCESHTLDAFKPTELVSIEQLSRFNVDSRTTGGRCVVRVVLLSNTKFKIIGFIASAHVPDNSKFGDLCARRSFAASARSFTRLVP